MRNTSCDVLVMGGGFGGVSAALALSRYGLTTVMVEPYPWIGGQATSQGLCVLDDLHDPRSERAGVSRSYAEFRHRVRQFYRTRYQLSAVGQTCLHLNPGNAICSHLAAEPSAAHAVIEEWLAPHVQSGTLTVLTGLSLYAAERRQRRVQAALFRDGEGSDTLRVEARFFLDATEMGDSYPLLEIPFRLGREGREEFDEPHAPARSARQQIQSFTLCAVVEWAPGSTQRLPKPKDYEEIRDRQGFHLWAPGCSRKRPAGLWMRTVQPDGYRAVPAWFYRSVVDPANFAPQQGIRPRTVINVGSTDYHDESLVEAGDRAAVAQRARHLTSCYLYWLQHEAPRDEGGRGYPEIQPAPDATGTPDGIAMAPYIREGRRLQGVTTVREQDLSAECIATARGRFFGDAVGLGGYSIDIHRCCGQDDSVDGVWQPTRAYQIPLGALVTPELDNFAAAGKGISVTQIANGAYRLHPEEWAIGEAAGMLAAYCLETGAVHPRLAGAALHRYQHRLASSGVPLYWYEDVPHDHPAFVAIQLMAVRGLWRGSDDHLRFDGEHSMVKFRPRWHHVCCRMEARGASINALSESYDIAHNVRKYDALHVLYHELERQGLFAGELGWEADEVSPVAE